VGQVATGIFSVGALIHVKTVDGHTIGATPSGTYTVIAPLVSQDPASLALSATDGQTQGYVTYVKAGQDASGATSNGTGGTQQVKAYSAINNPTGAHPDGLVSPAPINAPRSLPEKALAAAYYWSAGLYVSGHAGSDGVDCSGLVSWAYNNIGIGAMFIANNWGAGLNGDTGPQGIYHYFLSKGAREIDPLSAVRGDLLFINENRLVYNLLDCCDLKRAG